MERPISKKQIKITADLIGRACTNLSELGVDYVVIVRGLDTLISNVGERFGLAIAADAVELHSKIKETEIDKKVELLTDRGQWEE